MITDAVMSPTISDGNYLQPETLQEAINLIKYLNTTHKLEISKWRENSLKQAEVIKKLEANRKKELSFLSSELHNYEINLALRTETVAKQLADKDTIILSQAESIKKLNEKIKLLSGSEPKIAHVFGVPEISIIHVDSNSDSGVAMENEELSCAVTENEVITKPEAKVRKCRRFADSINFLRRVDFSPMKYKPSCNRETTLKVKKEPSMRKHSLEILVPLCKRVERVKSSSDRPLSDDDRSNFNDSVFSDSGMEPIFLRHKMNDSMNNHFSDDGSEDTSEEVFDRVMTRSSIRRSVKANPKYKKINRTKSKLLEQVKINIVD